MYFYRNHNKNTKCARKKGLENVERGDLWLITSKHKIKHTQKTQFIIQMLVERDEFSLRINTGAIMECPYSSSIASSNKGVKVQKSYRN